MSTNTYIVEDDTADPLYYAHLASMLAFKGDIYWVRHLGELQSLIDKNGFPKRLILDNNLGDGSGLDWLEKALINGTFSPDVIIAALSSTNISLVLNRYHDLNQRGIGAFPKPHIAELVLWMTLKEKDKRDNTNFYWNQDDLYNVTGTDNYCLTNFGKNFIDGLGMRIDIFKPYHPAYRDRKKLLFQSNSLVVRKENTYGMLSNLLSSGLGPKDIMGKPQEFFFDWYQRQTGEGSMKSQERK